MKLKKIENASVIHIRQYRDWRNCGVAFEFGDQTYTVPNRTMAAYTEVGDTDIQDTLRSA
jgi:glyoxylate carboligase